MQAEQQNKTLVLTVGAPGSGKSTWANEQCKTKGVANVNRDNLRGMTKALNSANEWKYSTHNEKMVTDLMIPCIDTLFQTNHTVIVSDTNLNQSTFNRFFKHAKDNNYTFKVENFHVGWRELLKRNLHRGDKAVPINILRDFYRRMRNYMGGRTYVPNPDMRKAVIVDIDGTVADNNGRHPFDWAKVGEDLPINNIISLVLMYAKNGYDIVFVSGRDGCCYDESLQWLKTNVINPEAFFMRKPGDSREDSIIKEEIFWSEIAHKWNVQMVIDDRATVVEMWRSLGLTCLQVNDGDF